MTLINRILNLKNTANPPTTRQLEYAKDLGINVKNWMSFDDVSKLIDKAAPERPPSKSQIEQCNQVGIEIKTGMTKVHVETLLHQRQQEPAYIAKQDAINKAKKGKAEAKLRKKYGDNLIDESNLWWKRSESADHYLLIFKRGKNIVVDVAEIDGPEIVDCKKPYLKACFSLPKLIKEKGEDDYLEWEKSLNLRPKQILHCQKLKSDIDNYDLKQYQQVVNAGIKLAKNWE